ncbi:hypothetical protein [Chitinophaga pinensis]|uniref:Uncharacterized protein n=1 Tax=Chitinophaga pinensis (strain ATCC 43595 / DSM 2588 / LMG 13176 / NBRC 15968 / NCIMB 11800 / UQM 2034) TaxID=485918 RepID=A0A979FYN7_CHIPD|nr:hypothetical protein [Chitinophaga pinensis]ACU57542.1 hypothetical protein Cpin_0035 [Chitinophaga pinensis DSM 2588]
MKKAKIILASISILALVGGAFAFKARTEIGRSYLWTNSYVQGTVTYQLPGLSSFCINTTAINLTDVRPNPTQLPTSTYRTTAPSTTITTLTSGTFTKTIPYHTCVFTENVYTTVVI